MSTEEIVAAAISKLINWIIILVTGYFWLVINHIKKDINNVAEYAREVKGDVERLEDITTCLKINIGKMQQQVEDHIKVCTGRHKK
jgi:DNA anti-recombination protein RmuC